MFMFEIAFLDAFNKVKWMSLQSCKRKDFEIA